MVSSSRKLVTNRSLFYLAMNLLVSYLIISPIGASASGIIPQFSVTYEVLSEIVVTARVK
jgi:hypothetical protein